MTKTICDRCNAEINDFPNIWVPTYNVVEISSGGTRKLDLCRKCKQSLSEWLQNALISYSKVLDE